MKFQIKYPIKYSLMPIVEQTGWIRGFNQLEEDENTILYIVSKCYVVSSKKEYKKDGSTITQYEVVFPEKITDVEYQQTEKNLPHKNIYGDRYVNSIQVEDVFDTIDEATLEKNRRNEELKEKYFNEIIFQEKLDMYNKIEMIIAQKTSDLDISFYPLGKENSLSFYIDDSTLNYQEMLEYLYQKISEKKENNNIKKYELKKEN